MKTVINIKADKDVKEKAQRVARELGLPLSTVINVYLKDFIRRKEIYVTAAPRMTPKLERIIARAERDWRNGVNISPALSTPAEIEAYLKSL